MTDYTKSTNFAVKDSLLSGDPEKVIRGVEIDDEFNNIQTSNNSKLDESSRASNGGDIVEENHTNVFTEDQTIDSSLTINDATNQLTITDTDNTEDTADETRLSMDDNVFTVKFYDDSAATESNVLSIDLDDSYVDIGTPTAPSSRVADSLNVPAIYLDGTRLNTFIWQFQNKQVYATDGGSTFTVPDDVGLINFVVLGAGGAGGSDNDATGQMAGGSSGALKYGSIPVDPGEDISVTVGAGGINSSVTQTRAGSGEDSVLSSANYTITADGGQGGEGNPSGGGGTTGGVGPDVNDWTHITDGSNFIFYFQLVNGIDGSDAVSASGDGSGGDAPFGLGTGGTSVGQDATGNGAGGAGGEDGIAGGDGAPGLVVIWY